MVCDQHSDGPRQGGEFTSDIDILARLHDYPRSRTDIYRTWEVKVSLLTKEGGGRSLKERKTSRTLTQLRTYRRYGSPDVTLLDVYLCEAGFMRGNPFPPPVLEDSIAAKVDGLRREGFGYQVLPFEHRRDGDTDVGLLALRSSSNYLQTTFSLLPATEAGSAEPFSQLAQRIHEFVVSKPRRNRKTIVVFCRECRSLQLIPMEEDPACPDCNADLVAQS